MIAGIYIETYGIPRRVVGTANEHAVDIEFQWLVL